MLELSVEQLKLLQQQMAEEGIDLSFTKLIPRLNDRRDLKLSFAQQQLWLLDQIQPGDPTYSFTLARLMIGELNVSVLKSALTEIERRHETLRTTFTSVDGQPRQVIRASAVSQLQIIDLETIAAAQRSAEAQKRLAAEALRPFDLALGPLFRATLFRLGDQEHILALTMHHIISDGWSTTILWRELSQLYTAFLSGQSSPLPELAIQYADYVAWQREQLTDEVLTKELDYWKTHLAGAPPLLQLPLARPRPAFQRSGEASATLTMDQAQADALRKLSRAEGVTTFMTVAAAFALVLSRHSGQDEIVIGTPVAGRNRREVEELIGFFTNTLVLRIDLRGNPTFRELLRRVQGVCLNAYAHQTLNFEQLIEELKPKRDQSHTPIFQVSLNMFNFERGDIKLPGITTKPLATPLLSKFDLTLYIVENPEAVDLRIVYNPDLFDRPSIVEMIEQLRHLCSQIVHEPCGRISHFSLLTPRTATLLPDPAKPLGSSWQGSVQELFSKCAARWPNKLALQDEHESFSYNALDVQSNRLANYLLAHGTKRQDVVVIYGHRSAALVLAILGTLKAGAVFCVLDPAHPDARVIEYLKLAKPRGWLQLEAAGEISSALDEAVKNIAPNCRLLLTCDAAVLSNYSADDPRIEVGSDDVACLTFTSGSTGQPKGVLGRHQSLSHYAGWISRTFKIDNSDRFSMLSNLSHDPLQRDIFTALQLGATLCIPNQEEFGNPGWLAHWMAQERITVSNLTPPMIRLLSQTGAETGRISTLRYAFVVGDILTKSDVARLRDLAPAATCINLYGTTETQRALGFYIVPDETNSEKESLPIGLGIDEVELLVLNAARQLCGAGELGEIYVRSAHLALGYLDDSPLSNERFITNPFTNVESDRLYRTGDLGRYLTDGNVELFGRDDQQVQIRGFRVEPAEIESTLKKHHGVNDCVVVAQEGSDGDKQLVAYVVPSAHCPPTISELTRSLRDSLPTYMIPAAFVTMESLPLTANGKLDRQALPAPDRSLAEAEYIRPRTPIEEMIAGIVAQLLNVDEVGVHDNFFDIGGHSLLAMQLIARLRAAFRVALPLRELFEMPTVAGLASCIERQLLSSATEAPPITHVSDNREPLVSFSQEAWLLRDWWEHVHQLPMRPSHEALAFRLSGELDYVALQQALNEVIRRHEALRAAFPRTKGMLSWQGLFPVVRRLLALTNLRDTVQKLNNKISSSEKPNFLGGRRLFISQAETLPLRVIDLQRASDTETGAEMSRLINDEIRRPFDLGRSPLLRVACIKLAPQEHVVSVVMHHLIADGMSKRIFLRDLITLYGSIVEAKPSGLPELSIQYSDFARWQREWFQGERLESMLAYWQEQFKGDGLFPELTLPFANPAPPSSDFRNMDVQIATIDSALHKSLLRLSQQQGVTLYMTLIGVLNALLYRYTGREKIRIFAPFANRAHLETQDVFGWFANTHVLAAECFGDLPFTRLLERVRKAVLGGYAHQEVPYWLIVKMLMSKGGDYKVERNPAHVPYIFFDFSAHRPGRTQLPNLTVSLLQTPPTSGDAGVEVRVREHADSMELNIKYSPDRVAPVHITSMLADFKSLLECVVANPDARLDELRLER